MVDRLTLLDLVIRSSAFDTSSREGVRKGLDAALGAALPDLPLSAAKTLPPAALRDLDLMLRDSVDKKAVEALAKAWEPSRKPDADQKASLRADLSDLLLGRRPVYSPPKLGLDAARSLGATDRAAFKETVRRLAPNSDLKKLLTAWDKHLKPAPTTREDRVARITALLDGASPIAAPPRAPRRR